jgi:hypothetical protein
MRSALHKYLLPSRFHDQPHISTRQYARIVDRWVERAGFDSSAYGTDSMRRTKAAQIYKKSAATSAARCASNVPARPRRGDPAGARRLARARLDEGSLRTGAPAAVRVYGRARLDDRRTRRGRRRTRRPIFRTCCVADSFMRQHNMINCRLGASNPLHTR